MKAKGTEVKRIILYSSVALEPWDWTNPWAKGIGGSETSHIELAERLGKRYDGMITSYAPVEEARIGPALVDWLPFAQSVNVTDPAIWLIYRDPTFFDLPLHPDSRYWFIAQDVDYNWTPERLAKVHRYICLCPVHVEYTLAKYPELKGRVFLSTNGIRSDYLKETFEVEGLRTWDYAQDGSFNEGFIHRNPQGLFWASSPDRGLLLLLEHWFRIKERVPDATLRIAYGFDNMEALLARGAWNHLLAQKGAVERLLNQHGVTWLGRIPQHDVYREWFKAGVFFYPTDWPETSCIACMEAQACGAIPITTPHWALKQNILHGILVDGIPQSDPLTRSQMIRECCDLMLDKERQEKIQPQMMEDARDSFDWQKIVDKQLVGWIEEDMRRIVNA